MYWFDDNTPFEILFIQGLKKTFVIKSDIDKYQMMSKKRKKKKRKKKRQSISRLQKRNYINRREKKSYLSHPVEGFTRGMLSLENIGTSNFYWKLF